MYNDYVTLQNLPNKNKNYGKYATRNIRPIHDHGFLLDHPIARTFTK